jgi:hypothetical protein
MASKTLRPCPHPFWGFQAGVGGLDRVELAKNHVLHFVWSLGSNHTMRFGNVDWLPIYSSCISPRPGAEPVHPVRWHWASDRQGPLRYVQVTWVARLVSKKKELALLPVRVHKRS